MQARRPIIDTVDYEPQAAMAVLSNLDPFDRIEAQAVRGAAVTHLTLFADWHAMQSHHLLSLVILANRRGRSPFALLAVANTGQAGVAQAAFLARSHDRWRREIAACAIVIRNVLPGWMQDTGVHRIEARCWTGHPTAATFLAACGFRLDCHMPGFGASGDAVFAQWSCHNRPPPSNDHERI